MASIRRRLLGLVVALFGVVLVELGLVIAVDVAVARAGRGEDGTLPLLEPAGRYL
jgi:hypothetical protein